MNHVLRYLDLILACVLGHTRAHGMNACSVLFFKLNFTLVNGLLKLLRVFKHPHDSELSFRLKLPEVEELDRLHHVHCPLHRNCHFVDRCRDN